VEQKYVTGFAMQISRTSLPISMSQVVTKNNGLKVDFGIFLEFRVEVVLE
jgi:hypothetical protein